MFTFAISAQESIEPQLEKEGDLTKVAFFHDNGAVAQTGYLKDDQRHGNWVSFDTVGEKVSMGSFKSDKKNGQWFFWKENDLIEVTYKNNKIVNIFKWNKKEKMLIANNE